MPIVLYCCRQNQAKLSTFSAKALDNNIKALQNYIPSEFNRKMRPLHDLLYWKAAEFRLFLLYGGFVVLDDKNVLSKDKYVHFLKFAVAMRFLLCSKTTQKDLKLANRLLQDFVNESSILYGKSFVTYNVHSLVHLCSDYERFGSLDTISAFPFESYLGLIKSSVKSGNRPFPQVANYIYHVNEHILSCSSTTFLSFGAE